ncbi:hypothetical protein [Xanthomonas oryzae]|uniref:hypothetical protein n=1 Tax=Xanthomonas oryzae TaxID=347 RepID=UPI0025415F25|nr:hypothetical protein [Xanthomonas oryzae]
MAVILGNAQTKGRRHLSEHTKRRKYGRVRQWRVDAVAAPAVHRVPGAIRGGRGSCGAQNKD